MFLQGMGAGYSYTYSDNLVHGLLQIGQAQNRLIRYLYDELKVVSGPEKTWTVDDITKKENAWLLVIISPFLYKQNRNLVEKLWIKNEYLEKHSAVFNREDDRIYVGSFENVYYTELENLRPEVLKKIENYFFYATNMLIPGKDPLFKEFLRQTKFMYTEPALKILLEEGFEDSFMACLLDDKSLIALVK